MAKTCGELFEGYDCTILGDGNISIILDIQSLYSAALENSQ